MLLSRSKAADDPKKKPVALAQNKQKQNAPSIEDFIAARDYTGAIAFLEFCRQSDKEVQDLDLWIAYAAFHAGDYQRASDVGTVLIAFARTGGIHLCVVGLPVIGTIRFDSLGECMRRERPYTQVQHRCNRFSDKVRSLSSLDPLRCVRHVSHMTNSVFPGSVDFQRDEYEYEHILSKTSSHAHACIYLACCYFMLGKYDEAERAALKGPKCSLQTRVLFHVAHKQSNEEKCSSQQRQLKADVEDQMSLASMHYMKSQFQEALEIYKRFLAQNRDYLALNVYVALCYYKLELNDVSQEILDAYLKKHPESATAVNLQACNQYRLYDGRAAEDDLKQFLGKMNSSFSYAKELFRHNMVVFQNGHSALQVLPPLIDVIPEARLNLVIYHLKQDDLDNAFELMRDVEPMQPAEFILKGVVNAAYGQEHNSWDHMKTAQSCFELIGSSASECDTIPGRQSMAASHFLHKRFHDVIVYLTSIKSNFYSDDIFNFNYAQAQAQEEKWKDAEETFLLIQNEKMKNDFVYLSWLARCYIFNSKPRLAWELYLRLEQSNESFALLKLIANDCYKRGHFFYAARAFDILERINPDVEYWEGKQGACAGAFQQIIVGHEPRDTLRDILSLLRNTNRPQGENMIKIMRSWARTNNVAV